MIDTHCHLDFRQYKKDRAEVIGKSLSELVALINVGAGLKASRDTAALSEEHDRIYAAVGLHPRDTEPDLGLPIEEQLNQLRVLVSVSPEVVAVGETGLDYFSDPSRSKQGPGTAPPGEGDRSKEEQEKIFRFHINLAREFDLPLVVHSRDSIGDVLNILLEEKAERAVFHCFTYDKVWAQKVLDAGYLISFTGIVTFKNAQTVQETARYVPLDKMMLETDAPFLAPVPYRSKRCEPWMVKYVAEKIANLKGISAAEVEKVTDRNAAEFFEITD